MTINKTSVKYTIAAIIAMLFVVFALLPVLSQQASSGVSFGAAVVLAFGGDGDGSAGGDGGVGGDGGGCCGGDSGPGDGPGGDTGGDTVPHNPPPPPEEIDCTLFANPTSINQGQSSTLTWTTDNADSVSINQGIGSVGKDGNTSVSPSQTTTYTLTAVGDAGTVTCNATVTVNPPQQAPICTLTANPTSINQGQSSTLTWTTQNATSVTINQGIGSVSANGNTSVSPSVNTTYTLTATGPGGTVTCPATITVTQVQNPLLCTLTGNPTSLPFGGGNTTLTWTTDNATSVSIDQGIGSVSLDGSQSVFVANDKTFTLTAVRGNETKQCVVTIDVGPQNPPALSCDSFTASPNSFGSNGGNTTLTWATTGATSVSIDQGIGSVSVDGSRQESVSSDKTYTLTASNGSQTVTCTASVDVESGGGGGGGSSAPRCDYLRASDTNIRKGETITLSWKTRRGTELKIEPDIFSTRDDDEVDQGSIKVKPTKDTRYTLTVERGNRKDTCSVNVDVSGANVSVLSARDQQPITTISLTQIPYTGFEAGPFLTGLFYTLLALWSMAVAYVLVVKRGSVFGFSLPQARHAHSSVIPHAEYHAAASVAAPVATAPMNLPTGVYAFDTEEEEEPVADDEASDDFGDDYSDLENRAHRENVLLSSDALRLVADHGATAEERVQLLDEVIARAKAAYPREDGWLVLNRERISALFA